MEKTGGVHSGRDAVKAVTAGARGVQVVSALLKHGVGRLRVILDERTRWFEEHGYDKLSTVVGSLSFARCPAPSADERAHDVQRLPSWHGESGRGGATGVSNPARPHTGGLTGGCGESGPYSPQVVHGEYDPVAARPCGSTVVVPNIVVASPTLPSVSTPRPGLRSMDAEAAARAQATSPAAV